MKEQRELLEDLLIEQDAREVRMLYAQQEKDRKTRKVILIFVEVLKWIVGFGISFLALQGFYALTGIDRVDTLILVLLVAILIEVRRKEHGNRTE